MREIKFRAFDWKMKIWFDISIFELANGDSSAWMDIDIETVGQFTGLKDSNGKEIYEGDILDVVVEGLFENVKKFGVVEYDAPSFTIMFPNHGVSIGITEELEFLVVGNEHQNPELLK